MAARVMGGGARASGYLPQKPAATKMYNGQLMTAEAADALTNQGRERQGRYDAEQAALNASNAGIAANTSFRGPSGINYQYSTDGSTGAARRSSGGGGGGGDDGGGAGFNFDEAMAKINPLLPPVPDKIEAPPRIVGPTRADSSAAEAAAFGRAKDRIGKIGGGAMQSLTRMMGRRGLGGSGIEGKAIGQSVEGLRGELGDVVRDQTIEGLKRDWQVEDRNYAGDLGQRSNDMGFATTTRGQDINAAQGRTSSIPALLSLLRRSGTGAAY